MYNAICNPDFTKIQLICLIHLKTTSSTTKLLSISFLSSGSVIDIKEIYDENLINADFVLKSNLFYGGYLLYYFKSVERGCTIGGNIFDKNDEWYSKWDIPENFTIPFPCIIFNKLDEKSIGIISVITPNNFTIITSSLPKYAKDGKLYLSFCIIIDLPLLKYILFIL